MLTKWVYILICLFHFPIVFAQKENDSLQLNLHLKFGRSDLLLNKPYISKNQDTLQITTLKFYLSDIKVYYKDKTTFQQQNSFHLIDIEKPGSMRIPVSKYKTASIEKITFNIGIDSLTSSSGALGSDLDPTNGMYWAWQSGYINFKIEGISKSCSTRKKAFQFHIGGYQSPNYAMRSVALHPKKTNNEVNISCDIAEFFASVKLSSENSIMIPGPSAMKLADYSAKMFSVE
ncbi:MbnP family protein [Flavobacterium pedocola]